MARGWGGNMGYCSWLVSCALIRLDARTRWGSAKWVIRRLRSEMIVSFGGMMVKTTNSRRGNPGSIPPSGQSTLSLIWQKIPFWKRWGGSVTRLCADTCCGPVSGLLRLDGEWGWCMHWGLLEIGCVKRDLGVGTESKNLTAREPPWKQDGLPPMVNIMWIASAESRSVRGASHQPIFMGDYLTIYQTCLPCLPREWVTCFSGSDEVSVDVMWM